MDTQTLAAITAGKIEGKTVREIAAETGVSKSTVAYTLQAEEIRAITEQSVARIIKEAANDAVDVRVGFVRALKKSIEDDAYSLPGILKQLPKDKFVELALKESAGVRQTAGIDPSQLQSLAIVRIENNNTATVIPPEIEAFLRTRKDEVVDVEYAELGE